MHQVFQERGGWLQQEPVELSLSPCAGGQHRACPAPFLVLSHACVVSIKSYDPPKKHGFVLHLAAY